MVKVRRTGPKGDQAVAEWDPAKVAEGDPDAIAAVKTAEEALRNAREEGRGLFVTDEHGSVSVMGEEFDPLVDKQSVEIGVPLGSG